MLPRRADQAQRGARGLPRLGLCQPASGGEPVARLKEWRAVTTRYDKTAASCLGVLHLAVALDWLKR